MSLYADKPFIMEVSQSGKTSIVRIRGFADMLETEAFQDRLETLCVQPNALVVIDMSDLEFINSSGLGALIAGNQAAKNNGGKLRIANPQPAVVNVLEVTRLNNVLDIRKSVDEAVKA